MKKILPYILSFLTSTLLAGNVTLTAPSPQYGCPNTIHDITIGATNTSGISIPNGTTISATINIMDNTNTNILGTTTQSFSTGFANGATKYFTIPNVAFAGPMVCNVNGTVSFTYIVPQSYPITSTYTVQYPPDLSIIENPQGTIEVSTPLDIYSVRYFLNANYGTVNYKTTLTTYTPGAYGSYTAKAYDSASTCISVNPSNAVIIKDNAQITFPPLSGVEVGTADYSPGASSNNVSTSITYTSSDPAVATIVAGNIHIVGVGTVTITAHQASDATHYDAADVSQDLIVSAATGIKNGLNSIVTLYPNPSSDIVFLEFENTSINIVEVSIGDIAGLKIKSYSLNNFGHSLTGKLDLSELSEGMYLIHIKTDQGIITKKVTKKCE